MTITDSVRERFFAKCKSVICELTGIECWIWQGARTANGYGALKVNGRVLYAHRISFSMVWGHIPAGLVVHHKCFNKDCVNPEHLECVTPSENVLAEYNNWRKREEEAARTSLR